MISQPICHLHRAGRLDHSVDQACLDALGQLVGKSPGGDPSQELPELVEPTWTSHVQAAEDLSGPSGAEDVEALDCSVDLPLYVGVAIVV